MKENEVKTVPFKEQLAGERQLFTGKLSDEDLIPGSDVTLGKAKENWAQTEADFRAKKLAKRTAVLTKKHEAEKDEIAVEKSTQTTLVVPGVLVNLETPVPSLSNLVARPTTLPDLPSDEELKKLSTADLIGLAVSRGVEVKANVDDEKTIIEKLKGNYVEPVTDDLTGKSRAELEKIIFEEFQIDGTNKESYPNIGVLTEGIRGLRANAQS